MVWRDGIIVLNEVKRVTDGEVVPARLTMQQFVERARKVHGDKYDYSCASYVNGSTPVEIVCPVHGAFYQTPIKHIRLARGCPRCGGGYQYTTEEFIAKARCVHGDRYSYESTAYVNSTTKVCITCMKHGAFMQRPADHLQGKGCPKCKVEASHSVAANRKRTANAQASLLSAYGSTNPLDAPGARLKSQMTCMAHWGSSTFLGSEERRRRQCEFLEKRRTTWRKHWGTDHPFQSVTFRQHSLEMFGYDNPMHDLDICKKPMQTKVARHCVASSRTERLLFERLSFQFGADDVAYQFHDDARYPFICDFYIRSLDMFVELNAFFTHGGHWFDAMSEVDVAEVDRCLNNMCDHPLYASKLYVWCYDDVRKRECACDRHLRYAVFWRNDLRDVDEWMQAGCPVRYDWM